MKRVRITIDPHGVPLPPVYERLTRGSDAVDDVRLVNWNVANPPAGFLLRMRGDYRRFGETLADDPSVDEYDLFPLDDAECYCFLSGETAAASRALFENFTRGSLLTVPPILCHEDGSSTFTLVGTEADVQAAVEGVPAGVDVTVRSVGGERLAHDSALGRLSARQREAVEAALALGYYDRDGDATTADVAARLDCATATAAEHLRKAESTLVRALVDR